MEHRHWINAQFHIVSAAFPVDLTETMSNNHNTNNPATFVSDLTDARNTRSNRKPHLTYGQIRGLIRLFNYFFVVKDDKGHKKRLSRMEIQTRWLNYKRQVHADYGKSVKGTLNSEKSFVKRYSNPLSFLRYKLKRSKNLRVQDLAPGDRAYFYEIAGTDNIDELIRQQTNVDSIQSAMGPPPTKRGRYNSPSVSVMSQFSAVQPLPSSSVTASVANGGWNGADVVSLDAPAHPTIPIPPKLEDGLYTKSLHMLSSRFTIMENEQVLKKQAEIQVLYGEKCSVIIRHVRACLEQHPELIGFIPFSTADEQITNAFDYWLSQHVVEIKASVRDVSTFMIQIGSLRSDKAEWNGFLRSWKLHRIMHKNDFQLVWQWVIRALNVELSCGKEEQDDDGDEIGSLQ